MPERPRAVDARGFGLVGMPTEDEVRDAIEGLNGIGLQGRTLAINQARPREPRPAGGMTASEKGRTLESLHQLADDVLKRIEDTLVHNAQVRIDRREMRSE